jgi:hypothetical protein
MKKNLLIHAVSLCLLASCNKSVDNKVEVPPLEGAPGSLSQIIFIGWTNDTTTSNYVFDDENYLIKSWYDDNNTKHTYTRDEKKRIIKITEIVTIGPSIQESRITNVYYNNANEIAYAINSVTRDTSKVTDSLIFEYTNGSVTKINTFSLQTITAEQPGKYETFEYAGSNISKIRTFYLEDGIYNEDMAAYKYEFDDKINPFFTPDDIRFLGYGALSVNNVILETRILDSTRDFYDYYKSEYTYGPDNKPISETATSWNSQYSGSWHEVRRLYFYR